MPNRPTHHATHSGRGETREPLDTRWRVMLGVWLAIGAYLVLFFCAPLASLPAVAGEMVRRVDVLQTILVGDEIVREWFAGASWQGLAREP